MDTPLLVPGFARLDEYCQAWLMEPTAFAALWAMIRGTDLAAHVAAGVADPPPLRSQIEMVPARNGKSIAKVDIVGSLMKQRSSMGGSSTVQLRRDVRQAAADPNVSAILLAIDSPGGAVAGTADLAADVKAAAGRKPVYAQVEDLTASAAYWVASQADAIYANAPTALVGSIGTIMTVYDQSAAAEKEGVKALIFATGALKGTGVPGSPVTEEQSAYLQSIVNGVQAEFDAAVRKGRKMSAAQLAAVRTGGVWKASEAMSLGLIDGIQPISRTVDMLAAAADRPQTKRPAAVLPTIRQALPMKR